VSNQHCLSLPKRLTPPIHPYMSPDDAVTRRIISARQRLEEAKRSHNRADQRHRRNTWRKVRSCRRHLHWLYQNQNTLQIQQEFTRSENKCVDRILHGDAGYARCNVDMARLMQHFEATHSAIPRSDIATQETEFFLGGIEAKIHSVFPSDTELTAPITAEEVETQLKRLPTRSAPGPDGVPYSVFKKLPVLMPVLTRLYQLCLHHERIPVSWKGSILAPIYKKGDPGEPSNWRPINLQNAIYKIYAAILACRLGTNAWETGRISPTQKGFVPTNGCHEHGFIASAVLNQTKRKRRKLYQVWYDLAGE
jgi:hypothetical protein